MREEFDCVWRLKGSDVIRLEKFYKGAPRKNFPTLKKFDDKFQFPYLLLYVMINRLVTNRYSSFEFIILPHSCKPWIYNRYFASFGPWILFIKKMAEKYDGIEVLKSVSFILS